MRARQALEAFEATRERSVDPRPILESSANPWWTKRRSSGGGPGAGVPDPDRRGRRRHRARPPIRKLLAPSASAPRSRVPAMAVTSSRSLQRHAAPQARDGLPPVLEAVCRGELSARIGYLPRPERSLLRWEPCLGAPSPRALYTTRSLPSGSCWGSKANRGFSRRCCRPSSRPIG